MRETYGKLGVSRNNTFEGNAGVMGTADQLEDVIFFDPNAPLLSVSATGDTGDAANYTVEYAVSLEKMWEDGIFFDTKAEDAVSIVEDDTVIKMTVAVSDDDNFEQGGIERSHTLTYYREIDGEPGQWDQSNYFANLTFVGEYVAPVRVPGDCNDDGIANASDLNCVGTVEVRDAVLAALNTLPGDLDGNGDVAFADFLVLSTNFGQQEPAYAKGNIDLQGSIDFADFLLLSTNFGQSPATVAAVPEPSGILLLLLAVASCRWRRATS